MPRNVLSFALLGLAAPVTAQMSDGPFMACPLYLTVGANTYGPQPNPLQRNDIYLKEAGFRDLAHAAGPATPTIPDFAMSALFGSPPPGFELDAVSSDNCTVFGRLVGTDFVLDAAAMPANAWGGLLVSVSKNTPGGTCAAIAAESSAADGPGADLFSLVLPCSSLPVTLSCVPIGIAQRATDSGEMGFRVAATTPPSLPEMRDFDPYFTFYRAAPPLPMYLPPEPWLFFSLPATVPAAVHTFADVWFTRRNGAPLAWSYDGGTILRTKWNATTRTWSPPEVFLTSAELGIPGRDIDALGIDRGQNRILLSLVGGGLNDQLMVAIFSSTAAGPVVTHQASTYLYDDTCDAYLPIAKLVGGEGTGEIDGTCPTDPSNLNGAIGAAFGYIVDCRDDLPTPAAPWPVTMGASAFAREATLPGMRGYAINVSGAPPGSLAGLVIGFPGPLNGPTLGGASVLLIPTTSAMTYDWNFSPDPLWYGVLLDFQFAALANTGVELARTVRLQL